MKIFSRYLLPLILYCFITVCAPAQDTEFAKGFIIHAGLHSGMISAFNRSPELYVGGFQLIPQYTFVPGKLRAGIVAGGFYAAKHFEAQLGPTISVKLKTFNAGPMGSAANIHVSANHLWGTGEQKLIGGGIHADILNRLVLGITAHRDYAFNTWWLQSALAIRISPTKKTREIFNE